MQGPYNKNMTHYGLFMPFVDTDVAHDGATRLPGVGVTQPIFPIIFVIFQRRRNTH